MILAAAALVLLGLALFVGGVLTGLTVLYWLCVAACVAAGVFLVLARVRLGRAPAAPASPPPGARKAPPPATRQFSTPRSEPTDAPPAGAPPAGTPPAGATAAEAAPPVAPAAGASRPGTPPAGDGAAAGDFPGSAERPAVPGAASTAGPASHSGSVGTGPDAAAAGDPPVEEVEVTDLLLVVDLRDDVLVVDEHPRYHLPGCRWLSGRETIPLPLDEARTDGFTPCGWCEPDRTLAERERGRRAGRRP